MKILQSSSKGKGVRTNKFRGSYSSKSSNSHDSKSKSHNNSSNDSKRTNVKQRQDDRFAARFTDPRFQLSQRVRQHSHLARTSPENELRRAAASDPRFAARLATSNNNTNVHARNGNTYASTCNKRKRQKDSRINQEHRKKENISNNNNANADSDNDDNTEDEEESIDESDIGIEEYEYVAEDDDANYEHNGVFVGDTTKVEYNNLNGKRNDDDDNDDIYAWAPEPVEWTEPRYRLAIVDCDWDHIRAVDLYAILFHALPMGGELKEVNVYLSDFGKKMLEHERMCGPDLWVNEDNISATTDTVQIDKNETDDNSDTIDSNDNSNVNGSKIKDKTKVQSDKRNKPSKIVEENMKLLAEEEEKYRDVDEVDHTNNNIKTAGHRDDGDDNTRSQKRGHGQHHVTFNEDGNHIINYDNNNNNNNNNKNNNDKLAEDASWQEHDNINMLQECGEDGEYFSAGKYRKYEMDRMKYYYAIATFDSAATAAAVYAELDGMDIEASGVVLNLQYVDDDETFGTPVNRADGIPAHFKPLAAFKAAALTQSRFRISWDQEDAFRHFSMQDAFTGTTAEDDLAAYLAPANSDSDEELETERDTQHETLENLTIADVDSSNNNDNDDNDNDNDNKSLTSKVQKKNKRSQASQKALSKMEEKQRIRQQYAALLAEIGGLAESDNEQVNSNATDLSEDEIDSNNKLDEDQEEKYIDNDDDNDDNEDDSDDNLNRFSDVEFESEEDSMHARHTVNSDGEEENDNNNDMEMREMEATLDMDVDNKATQLQQEVRRRQRLENADLATQAELKYKQRRKEMKKTKKELLIEEREAEKEALRARNDEARSKLQLLMNVEDAGAIRLAGKQRRKEHARKVKARAAEEREAVRRRRVTSLLGVKDIAHEQEQELRAEQALGEIDLRFQHKLLDDPRFQLEVAQKDKRVATDVVDLAGKVALARRAKRQRSDYGFEEGTHKEKSLHMDKGTVAQTRSESINGHTENDTSKRVSKHVNAITSHTNDVSDVVNYFVNKKH